MEKLIAVQRNIFGEVINFQTSSGRIISYRKALQEVESGIIGGVEIIEEDGLQKLIPETDDGNGFINFPNIQ